jgi:hypothetical protein
MEMSFNDGCLWETTCQQTLLFDTMEANTQSICKQEPLSADCKIYYLLVTIVCEVG